MNKLNHLERFNEARRSPKQAEDERKNAELAGDQLVIHDYIKKNLKIEVREGKVSHDRVVYLDLILKDEVLSTQLIPVFRQTDVCDPRYPTSPSSWS